MTRRVGETVHLGDDITVTVLGLESRGDETLVRLGIEAGSPPDAQGKRREAKPWGALAAPPPAKPEIRLSAREAMLVAEREVAVWLRRRGKLPVFGRAEAEEVVFAALGPIFVYRVRGWAATREGDVAFDAAVDVETGQVVELREVPKETARR